MTTEEQYLASIRYIREKIDQMLLLMGTFTLRQEELDDNTLIDLDPIGIIVDSIAQVMENLEETNHQLRISQNEIRTILDAADASIVVLANDWTVEDCNAQAQRRMFGEAGREAILGRKLQDVVDQAGRIEREVWASGDKQGEFFLDDRWITIRATPVYDEQGNTEKMVFVYTDITAQKRTLDELRIYEQVFDNTDEGILVTDARTRIIKANRAFGRITGYTPESLTGMTPQIFKSNMHDSNFYREVWCRINQDGYWRGEIFDRRKDGSLVPLWQTISTIRDENNKVSHYISVINDISALRETQSRLDHLAHHDPLTDLPNRLLLHDRLAHAIQRSVRDASHNALLFIDLDRFKMINDSLGHLVGDKMLQQVAKRIAALTRAADTIARLGGDEFVILLEGITSRSDAERMAFRVIETLREPFTIDEHELHIGCSIGISISPNDGMDAITLLKNADTAMYQVKESGRDGYHIYSSVLSEMAEQRLQIESALRKLIQEEGFYLEYQPIVDAASLKIKAAEALVRWYCPSMGQVSPARFIPVAEDTNLIIPLGKQILAMALRQMGAWREQGLGLDYISVNVSGPQLYHSDFADNLIVLLEENGIQGHCLQLEITENVLMDDVDRCLYQLHRLREQGVRIAIDDFGTGYSSLAYLRSLPLDIIKVDQSFVAKLPGNQNDAVIARAIIGLAKSLDLGSVAEGIETAEQEAFLRELGCDQFQGYLYSRPVSAAQFLSDWQAHHRARHP